MCIMGRNIVGERKKENEDIKQQEKKTDIATSTK